MNREFWHGKKVLLTGHTGFKGSWLSLWLQDLGAQVTGFSLAPPSTPSLFEVARVDEGMISLEGDIREAAPIAQAMRECRPEIVVHMAAQSLVRYSYRNPVETYATNVMGLVHVLEAVRAVGGVRAVVVVTSDKCYENREWDWGYRETDPMGGFDPYSSSKGCDELLVAAYRRSYFAESRGEADCTALASVRAGNVIGGGDWAEDRLVPDMFRALAADRPLGVRNPAAIRPWQHVLEPLAGYMSLAQKLYEEGQAYAEGWNFGPSDDDARPVGWIIEHFVKLWGEGGAWQVDGGDHPHEAGYLKLDSSKARNRLDWRPRWSLADGLERIVSWHKAYLDEQDMRAFTLRQINEYQDSATS